MWRLLLSRGLPGPRRRGVGGPAFRAAPPPGLTHLAASVPEEKRSSRSFSSSSRGWHERRQQQQQQHNGCGCWSLLPRYTTLDAFTWGALAVLALQLAKQLQWLRSAPGTRGETGLWQLEKLLSVLPLHRHSVPRAAPTSHSRRHETPCFLLGADPDPVLENPHPGTSSQQGEYHPLPETDEFLFPSGQGSEPSPAQRSRQEKAEQQETLAKAASKVQEVFRTSVSVALNILGIEHMRDEHHEAAYSCFKTAADRGYSKAQFNVGLCYEHGRGIERDPAKAMLYYRRAAYQGHSMAQYRCAKWLLRHWPRADRDGAWEAVALLEQAATLGLTQDSQSRYHVGVCYEKGFGVPRNLLEARKHYQQSAAAGNKSAQERMRAMAQEELTALENHCQAPAATRAFSSSPCLESLDSGPVRSLSRSWSTGNLRETRTTGLSCRTTPALLDCCLLELQPLVFSPGIAIS